MQSLAVSTIRNDLTLSQAKPQTGKLVWRQSTLCPFVGSAY